ncbi:MAG TPA: signal recognition particle-docking protein FtsY, partial [Candidatus Limnocylindrales bacterium]
QPDLPMDDGPVTDAEIEAQLEAELAEPDAAEPTAEGARTERGAPRMEPPSSSAQVAAGDDEVRASEPAISPSSPGFADAPLVAGVERSRGGFMARLKGILGRGDPDAATWEEVEETLIAGDVGAALALEVVDRARRRRDGGGPVAAVRSELGALLVERETGWVPYRAGPDSPAIILVVGVNGTGKTTTIGKLAFRYRAEGQSVLLAAGDTFRAAAIEQLRAWGDRAGAPVVAHAPGADPSAVVYDAVDAAVARHVDVLIADTAGRLHTKSNLMDELAKMRRVIDRRLPGAIPEVLFVMDATTGQNGLAQAKAFHESTGLTGIILTKLDSTAKGGIVFAIEQALGVPVRFVGVGEQVADLLPFDPAAFVGALFG